MVYLDHAAATPVTPSALSAMQPFFAEQFFNPSSPYLPAKRVRETYEDHKNRLAHLVGAKGNDLIITAGATEANNLAFTALNQNSLPKNSKTLKILILATEHDSIHAAATAACHRLHATGQPAEVILIPVECTGRIDLAKFERLLDESVTFISVALVNGELGTIQPLSEIAEHIKAERLRRLEQGNSLPIFFHSDASQALGLLNLSVSRLGVDLLTLNSAKVGGPKGVGALFVGHQARLEPLTYGGGQERGLRAGTENVAGLVGFTIAAEEAQKHLASNRKKYADFVQILRTELLQSSVTPLFLGLKNPDPHSSKGALKTPKPSDSQLANFCPVCFPGIDAERLIYLLEDPSILIDQPTEQPADQPTDQPASPKKSLIEPVCVSTGAACAASKGEKSKTLQAIGLSDTEIAGSLRISLGPTNDEAQIHRAAQLIIAAVEHENKRIRGEI